MASRSTTASLRSARTTAFRQNKHRYVGKIATAWNHATEVLPHASARTAAKDFLSRATSVLQKNERMGRPTYRLLMRCSAATMPVPTIPDQGPVGTAGAYASFGKTTTGSPRWRCSACDKTFSQNTKATARQRDHHKNKTIFKLLVNNYGGRKASEI